MNRPTTEPGIPVAIPLGLPLAALNGAVSAHVLAGQGPNRDGTPLILRGHSRIRAGHSLPGQVGGR